MEQRRRRAVKVLNRIAQRELGPSADAPYIGQWLCGHPVTTLSRRLLAMAARWQCPRCGKQKREATNEEGGA